MNMNKKIRQAQIAVLKALAGSYGGFALAGGTALELYYLHHRFSADLDFFSPKYTAAEIKKITGRLEKKFRCRLKLESELLISGRAKVKFYTMPVKGSARPLKIDFVDDLITGSPKINNFDGTCVYSAKDIYTHKIAAVGGAALREDEIGRRFAEGHNAARDAFDIFMLSKKISPLHLFLARQPRAVQLGVVHWYRTFSRQDLKLELLGLDIYDRSFNSKEMIIYLEDEIKKFIEKAVI